MSSLFIAPGTAMSGKGECVAVRRCIHYIRAKFAQLLELVAAFSELSCD